MSFDMRRWILRHPRLLYLALILAMVTGSSLGFVFGDFLGMVLFGSISILLALHGYAFLRFHLQRTSDSPPPSGPPQGPPPEPPPEPPTEGAPRLAPLRPSSPLTLVAYAKLPRRLSPTPESFDDSARLP